jgi:hypothetical protein
MIFAQDADTKFWPLAVRHAVFIRNRMPNANMGWRIPYQEVFGRLPDMSCVRAFWSPAFLWIDPSRRKKLDARAKQLVYVGNGDHSSQYLLLDTSSGKLTLAGKPVIEERFDIIGQRVATKPRAPRDVLRFEQDFHLRPEPFVLKLSDRNAYAAPHRVLATSAWFNEEDHENVAVLQTDIGPNGDAVWLTASEYLTGHDDKRAAFKAVVDYSQLCEQTGRPNDVYPLLTVVTADTGGRGTHAWGQALVVAVDTSLMDSVNTMYTVVFHPDACSRQVLDVQERQVKWKPSADLAIALATCTPLQVKTRSADALRPDPTSYRQALGYPDRLQWVNAVSAELDSLVNKGVLVFTELPASVKAIATRFILKLKYLPDGTVDKYKARLVAKGFLQQYGVHYDETFSPTFQVVSLRCIFALALRAGLTVYHIDVKTAFLNSDLEYDIWIELPEGFKSASGSSHAKLHKSLYGLKQAGRDWYKTQDDFIKAYDPRFQRSTVEPCLYYIWTDDIKVAMLVHVDDYLMAAPEQYYVEFNAAFDRKFGTNDMGRVSNILQMGVTWTADSASMSQERQIVELAREYGVLDSAPVFTPMEPGLQLSPAPLPETHFPFRQLLGSLLWIARCTRPDITFATVYMSHFCAAYSSTHFGALKRVLKYLYHTRSVKLVIRQPRSDGPIPVSVWSDADWASDKATRRSVSGYLVTIGKSPVSWGSKRQHTVAMSSCESEYMALSEAAKSGLYVIAFFQQFKAVERPSGLNYDNQGSGYLASNTVNNDRSKHIDVRHHFIRDHVAAKTFRLNYVPTATNLADVFTKALPREPHSRFSRLIMTAEAA